MREPETAIEREARLACEDDRRAELWCLLYQAGDSIIRERAGWKREALEKIREAYRLMADDDGAEDN